MKKEEIDNFSEIFILSYAFNKRKLYYAAADTKGFNEYRFYESKWIDDWPEEMLFYFSGKPGEDFIPGGLHYMLISERARQVFIREKIPEVQFLPAKAILMKTGMDLGPYYILNVIRTVDKLDRISVHNVDLFRWKKSTSRYISKRLKQILEKDGVTSGAGFLRMPI